MTTASGADWAPWATYLLLQTLRHPTRPCPVDVLDQVLAIDAGLPRRTAASAGRAASYVSPSLGYDGKSALHTDQREPTGTNTTETYEVTEVVPCWFGSVRLLHRDFIAGRNRRADLARFTCAQHVHSYMAHRPIQLSLVEVKFKDDGHRRGLGSM
jgi:hypothetical protein